MNFGFVSLLVHYSSQKCCLIWPPDGLSTVVPPKQFQFPIPIQSNASLNLAQIQSPHMVHILPVLLFFEYRFECLVGQRSDIGSLTDFHGTVADVEDCVDVL